MNLNLTGHHLLITPAIREYISTKLVRVTRHFDHVIDVNVVLSVDKLRQQITANLHVSGKEIHPECVEADMYAEDNALAVNLDRQVLRHKEKRNGNRHVSLAIKPVVDAPATGKTRAR